MGGVGGQRRSVVVTFEQMRRGQPSPQSPVCESRAAEAHGSR